MKLTRLPLAEIPAKNIKTFPQKIMLQVETRKIVRYKFIMY